MYHLDGLSVDVTIELMGTYFYILFVVCAKITKCLVHNTHV